MDDSDGDETGIMIMLKRKHWNKKKLEWWELGVCVCVCVSERERERER